MQNISANDFFKPTPYNNETKNQIWMSQIADSHDNICDCKHPFAHLLASIFPPGHKDRGLSINQILYRDYKEKCHSGGEDDASPGLPAGTPGNEHIKEEDTQDQEDADLIEQLINAADTAEREEQGETR